jgi:hypothetical protein
MKNLILVVVAMLLAVVVSACGGLTFLVANAPAHFGDFDRDADIAYGTLERQKLDVYRPHGAKNLPVIVFWHGGGWTDDNKNQYRFVGAARSCARSSARLTRSPIGSPCASRGRARRRRCCFTAKTMTSWKWRTRARWMRACASSACP